MSEPSPSAPRVSYAMARKVAEDRLDDAHRYATGSPETRAIIFALDALGLRVLAAADRVAAVLADR